MENGKEWGPTGDQRRVAVVPVTGGNRATLRS